MVEVSYNNMKQFSGLYLEDSFVLQIDEMPEIITFLMEFVLNEDHPEYQIPLENEAYCYRYGVINFKKLSKVIWKSRNHKAISIDANNEIDLGNIDIFYKSGNEYLVEGDWGSVLICCSELEVKLLAHKKS